MAKKIIAQVDEVEKEITHLFDGGDVNVHCMSCDKPVFKLVKVKDEPLVLNWFRQKITIEKQKYQANCPYCNESTWIASQEGQLIYAGIDDETVVEDVDMGDPENNTLFTKLKVGRI